MDKQQNAKKRKIIKAIVIGIFASIGLAAIFIIAALATSENEAIADFAFFGPALGLLGVALILFFVYFQLLRSKWYAQHHLDTRLEEFETYRQSNDIAEFILPFKDEFEEGKFNVLFDSLLHDFTKDELGGGLVYYTLSENVFNKSKNSIDAFYFVPDTVKNTLGLVSEKFAIKVYIKQVEEFLAAKFKDTQFVNCVIVFMHDSLTQKGKDFYYNFAGENYAATANTGAFIRNTFYNYVGIEKDTLKTFFYYPLETDSGAVADLGHLIQEYLLAERPVLENDASDLPPQEDNNELTEAAIKQTVAAKKDGDKVDPFS